MQHATSRVAAAYFPFMKQCYVPLPVGCIN